jgi:hypothetical protein
MADRTVSEGWSDLVEELQQLEACLPLAGRAEEREEIEEEIAELEDLIAAAGEPDDPHSQRALAFLQQELLRKRSMLERL